jgi:hypothetical protein
MVINQGIAAMFAAQPILFIDGRLDDGPDP